MLKTLRAKGLSSTALKEIALALMLLDHIHYFFAFTGAVPEWFSMLGRVSAPLFLFCTVEGFAHTRDRKTYLLRLWALGAGMGLVQFLIGLGLGKRADGFYPMNSILRDLTVACLLWQGIDWLRQRRFGRALALIGGVGVLWPAVSLALMSVLPPVGQLPVYFLSWTVLPSWTFSTDGGIAFILGGVLLYALRERLGGVGPFHRPGQRSLAAARRLGAGPAAADLLPVDGGLCRAADAPLQRAAGRGAQEAVLLVLPGPRLRSVCAVLCGDGVWGVKRWPISLRWMTTPTCGRSSPRRWGVTDTLSAAWPAEPR